jgi:hypothetical protein
MCHIFVHKHLCTIYGCPTAPQSEKLVGEVEGEAGKGSLPYWSISCATLKLNQSRLEPGYLARLGVSSLGNLRHLTERSIPLQSSLL